MRPKELPSLAAVKPVAVGETIETNPGERRRVALADGSVLYLNAGTKVKVEADRRVTLSKGEVYVEVAPLVANPAELQGDGALAASAALEGKGGQGTFVLSTPHRQVTALGTRFRVREEAGGTNVLVEQGRVKVSGLSDLLYAGSQLQPAAEGEPRVVPVARSAEELAWLKDLMQEACSPLVPASQYAGGALVAVDPQGQQLKLSLRKFHVDVHVEDGFARTTIDQTYFNHDVRRLEGTFYFPLPPDASLSRLAMYVNGQLMEGGMAERDYARKVFESIVTRMKDPALLEWVDGSTFKMRVFPLEGRQEKRIILSYVQKLPVECGKVEYRFPAGHSLEFVKDWAFHARVAGILPARGEGILPSVASSSLSSSSSVAAAPESPIAWASPSHQLEATANGRGLLLDVHEANARLNRDVVFHLWTPAPGAGDERPATFRAAYHEGAKYLMLRYRPTLEARPRKEHRDWIFLFESGGDRNPLLARAQVEIVRAMLENAEHSDRFAILSAGTRTTQITGGSADLATGGFQAATPKNVRAAVEALEQTHLVGALDLGQALAVTMALAKDGHSVHVVHLGSATPILGEKRQEALVKMLTEWQGKEETEEAEETDTEEETAIAGKMPAGRKGETPSPRYVGVGVGKQWNRSFMKAAAAKTGGYFTQINPDENIPWRSFELLSTLNTPRLMDVKVVDSAERTAFLCDCDAVSHGGELCAIARVDGAAPLPASVVVTGTLDGKPLSKVIRVPEALGAIGNPVSTDADKIGPASPTGAGYLPRAWAKMEIDRLVDEGAEKNRARIVELSKSMYVMSPFTSLLVLENEAMYQQYNVDRGRKDHWAMYACPPTIPVVTEPGNDVPSTGSGQGAPTSAAKPAPSTQPSQSGDAKKIEEVLSTILVRVPPRMLLFPSQGPYYAVQCVTAWQAITGAYAIPCDSLYGYMDDSDRRGRGLDEVQIDFLRQAEAWNWQPNNLAAPRLAIWNGQAAYMNFTPTGTVLDVGGTISADRRYVMMTADPTNAQLNGFTSYFTSVSGTDAWGRPISGMGQIQLPNVTVEDLATKVSVPDGGTLLLGGQMAGGMIEREEGAPLLSSVPVIRRLFPNGDAAGNQGAGTLYLDGGRLLSLADIDGDIDPSSINATVHAGSIVYENGALYSPAGANAANSMVFAGATTINGTTTFTTSGGIYIAGQITGAGNGALGNSSGAPGLWLNGSGNSYSGGTIVSTGTITSGGTLVANGAITSSSTANDVAHKFGGLSFTAANPTWIPKADSDVPLVNYTGPYTVTLDGTITAGNLALAPPPYAVAHQFGNLTFDASGQSVILSGGANGAVPIGASGYTWIHDATRLSNNALGTTIGGYLIVDAGPDEFYDTSDDVKNFGQPSGVQPADIQSAIRHRNYGLALRMMDQSLAADPSNQALREQKYILQQVELLQREKGYQGELQYQQQQTLIDLREAEIPWYELLRYPKDWREITARREPYMASSGNESEQNRQTLAKLKRKIAQVGFDNTEFKAVVEWLQQVANLNIQVKWTVLETAGVTQATMVKSVHLTDVSVEKALRTVLDDIGGTTPLSYVIDEGVLTISTKDDLSGLRYRKTLVYDISDLLVTVPDFAGPRMSLNMSSGGGQNGSSSGSNGGIFGGSSGGSSGGTNVNLTNRADIVNQLTRLIARTVDKDSWMDPYGTGTVGSMSELSGQLVITQTADNHRAVLDLINQLRESKALQITIECRFLSVSSGFLDSIGIDIQTFLNTGAKIAQTSAGSPGVPAGITPTNGLWQGQFSGANWPNLTPIAIAQNTASWASGSAASPLTSPINGANGSIGSSATIPAIQVFGTFLDDIQVDFMIQATQANQMSRSLTAPRLTIYNGQNAYVTFATQQAYVANVTPVVAENVVAYQATVAFIPTGTVLQVQGTVSADRRYVMMTVQPQISQLNGFTTYFTSVISSDANGQPLSGIGQIQLPNVTVQDLSTTVSVPDGGTLLLGGQKATGELEREEGAPILSKIPVIRRLFTNTGKVRDEQTILILIKPKIIIHREEEERSFPGLASPG
jgi:type II secretory pathway component GspD/PulD (secretin)